ncbi:MAG TPA: EF-hand domain-containing protein [Verrucomicrobiae bacterium]|nr:EF-hand domain-containing protein [Verrucomicrobiae bacterium]
MLLSQSPARLSAAIVFLFCSLALCLGADTPVPRLAIVPEQPSLAPLTDLLTAGFSQLSGVALLERAEIEKVYREQALSAASPDVLKLGQLLGADGLLLLTRREAGEAASVTVRLIAVGPGVILSAQTLPLEGESSAAWAATFPQRLRPLLPKLMVLKEQAIPISILNLRSAVQSPAGIVAESQLKALLIQRLATEPRLFVLERERLELLNEEKELRLNSDSFWSGAYLVDGAIDRETYQNETLTLDARLIPPRGGLPMSLSVAAPRTNFAAVVNGLAEQIVGKLSLSSMPAWSPAEEAARFVEEAEWALKWELFSDAQAAAESAWALGKRDLRTALVRVRAYTSGLPIVSAPDTRSYGRDRSRIRRMQVSEHPDPSDCDTAIRALNCYEEFWRISPDGEARVEGRSRAGGQPKPDWYTTGVEALQAASHVLQQFHWHRPAFNQNRDKIATLRATARRVARLILSSESVRASYFVGDRVATHDELAHSIAGSPNIFECILTYGALWQERPEDSLDLYRELMASPVFSFIHDSLWFRPPHNPRLVAWNEDGTRLPRLWDDFVKELSASSNGLLRLEAKAFAFADAPNDDAALAQAFTNFFDAVYAERDTLVTNSVGVLYLNWGAGDLISGRIGSGVSSAMREALQQSYYSDHNGRMRAMEREYWSTTIPQKETAFAFAAQKTYLAALTPFETREFNKVFSSRNYTRAQAAELVPLVAAYKSNLLARARAMQERSARSRADAGARWVELFLEQHLTGILGASTSPPVASRPSASNAAPVATPQIAAAPKIAARTNILEVVSNIVTVSKFLPLPVEELQGDGIPGAVITAHRWQDNRLMLELAYTAQVYTMRSDGQWKGTRYARHSAVALLEPDTGAWTVASCPELDVVGRGNFYHRSACLGGELYMSESKKILKYDFARKQWNVLPISDGGNYQLFVINNRLFASDAHVVMEILEGGRRTRIMASRRRTPPVSLLDSEPLDRNILFAGPNGAIRLATETRLFSWNGADWQLLGATPCITAHPEIFPEGVLFRGSLPDFRAQSAMARLLNSSPSPELLVSHRRTEADASFAPPSFASRIRAAPPSPFWKSLPNVILENTAASLKGSNLFLLVAHSEAQDIKDEKQNVIIGKRIVARNGYHAALHRFSPELPSPQTVHLKFESGDASPPLTGANGMRSFYPSGLSPSWMLWAGNHVFFGLEQSGSHVTGGYSGRDFTNGVWVARTGEIEAAHALQSRIQRDQAREAKAAEDRRRKLLMTRFDSNKDGRLAGAEMAEALNDDEFAALELERIDENSNRRLDAAELIAFDLDGDRTLGPREQSAIHVVQQALARAAFRDADIDGSGALTPAELSRCAGERFSVDGFDPDENRNRQLDFDEFLSLQRQLLRSALQTSEVHGKIKAALTTAPPEKLGPQSLFKMQVEAHWGHQPRHSQ